MPTIITSASFTTTFNYTTTPKKFVFTDTTDLTSPSIPSSGVKDVFKITDPNGNIIYNNTNFAAPDILRSTAATNTTTIPLPLIGSGTSVVAGIYTIVMTTQIIDGVNPTYTLVTTSTYDNTFVSPTISITPSINCISPLFTATDTTNYVVNGVTPTISGTIGIYYPTTPATSTINTFLSAGGTVSTGSFYGGMQTILVTSTLSYTFPDGLIVTETISGQKSVEVDCTFVCDIYCCLRSLEQNMVAYKNTNQVKYQYYKDIFEQVMGLVQMVFIAVDCGKQNDVDGYLSEIKTLAQCTDDCSCNDGTPALVVGLGTNSVNVVVQSGGAPITVTSNTVGATTTYTVTFDAALVAKINASYNTVVAAGVGVTVTSATVGDVTTYTVNSSIVDKNFMSWQTHLTFTSAPALTITTNNVTLSGTSFTNPPTVVSAVGFPALANNLWTVSSFKPVAVTAPYKILATLIQVSARVGFPAMTDIQILTQGNNTFQFLLRNGATGAVYTPAYLATYSCVFDIHFMLITT